MTKPMWIEDPPPDPDTDKPIRISEDLFDDLREYLENRADIDNDGGPNRAMRLLATLDEEVRR